MNQGNVLRTDKYVQNATVRTISQLVAEQNRKITVRPHNDNNSRDHKGLSRMHQPRPRSAWQRSKIPGLVERSTQYQESFRPFQTNIYREHMTRSRR